MKLYYSGVKSNRQLAKLILIFVAIIALITLLLVPIFYFIFCIITSLLTYYYANVKKDYNGAKEYFKSSIQFFVSFIIWIISFSYFNFDFKTFNLIELFVPYFNLGIKIINESLNLISNLHIDYSLVIYELDIIDYKNIIFASLITIISHLIIIGITSKEEKKDYSEYFNQY